MMAVYALEQAEKALDAAVKPKPEQTIMKLVGESKAAKSETIPEMPKKSELASKYVWAYAVGVSEKPPQRRVYQPAYGWKVK